MLEKYSIIEKKRDGNVFLLKRQIGAFLFRSEEKVLEMVDLRRKKYAGWYDLSSSVNLYEGGKQIISNVF